MWSVLKFWGYCVHEWFKNWTHKNIHTAFQKLPLDSVFLTSDYFSDSTCKTVIESHLRLKRGIFVSLQLHFSSLLIFTAPARIREQKGVGSWSNCFLLHGFQASHNHNFCVLNFIQKIKTKYTMPLVTSQRPVLSHLFRLQVVNTFLFGSKGRIDKFSHTVF